MTEAFRASIFHCLDDPGEEDSAAAWEFLEDGLLVVADGKIAAVGAADDLLAGLEKDIVVNDFRGHLLLPGFIDCHVHSSQLDIVASDGSKLLNWLSRYAYPEESRFADAGHARSVSEAFVDELLRNGTTSALVFTTVHSIAVDALFEAAAAHDMRLIAGKVMMDRNCPDELKDDAATAYEDSRRLLERWHGKGRLGYAITPRFALTSSEKQLEAAGRLAAEYPEAWVHTHLAEDHVEVDQIRSLFPERRSYLDVYDHFGLLREKSVFAHCLHLDTADVELLAAKGGAAAFCPTSNLFLGSGLFDLRGLVSAGVRVGLATDVGGGTSLSMLKTASEAYKILHMQDQSLSATRGLYLATLGAARALGIDAFVGNLEPGKEADFIVLDPAASSLSARRLERATSAREILFAWLFLGDERHVAATFLRGKNVSISSASGLRDG